VTLRSIAVWYQRHRRALLVGYLAVLGLACAVLIVPPLRGAVLSRTARLFALREDMLRGRIDRAETLVAEGDYEAAASLLYELDARFPAKTNRHALDRDRERILHALGAVELARGRKGRALTAYRRAVDFDPRNIANHHALAMAALQLGEDTEAEEHLTTAFMMFPSHAGAVRSLIDLRFERADYSGVVALFETYVAAARIHTFGLTAGDVRSSVRLPVDGRPHRLRVAVDGFDLSEGLAVRSLYPTLEVLDVRWEAAARAGVRGREVGVGTVGGPDRRRIQLPPNARLALITTRAGIPIDAATWTKVQTAYRNLLRPEAARAVEPRLDVIGSDAWDAAVLEL